MDLLIRKMKAWFALRQARREYHKDLSAIYDQYGHYSAQGQRAYEKLARRIDERYEQKRQEVLKCYGLSSLQDSEESLED